MLRDEFNRSGGPSGTTHHAEVDERSEGLILKQLAEAFPEDGFLGEELGCAQACSGLAERYWVVDPNDGTGAFIEKGAAKNVNQYY